MDPHTVPVRPRLLGQAPLPHQKILGSGSPLPQKVCYYHRTLKTPDSHSVQPTLNGNLKKVRNNRGKEVSLIEQLSRGSSPLWLWEDRDAGAQPGLFQACANARRSYKSSAQCRGLLLPIKRRLARLLMKLRTSRRRFVGACVGPTQRARTLAASVRASPVAAICWRRDSRAAPRDQSNGRGSVRD